MSSIDILDLFNVVKSEASEEDIAKQDAAVLNIMETVEAELKSDNFVTRDLSIDDSSCKEAPNFLEWIVDKNFLNDSPYLEQALIGLKLYAEYCPRCSNLEWMRDDKHVPQEGIRGIRENVMLLRYGKCPECGSTRSEMFKTGELNYYNELAVNAGQRCLTGNSVLYTDHGMVRLDSFESVEEHKWTHSQFEVRSKSKGFSRDETTNATRIWKNKPERCFKVTLEDGTYFIGTAEHPIALNNNIFTTLKNVSVGLKVTKHYGQYSFGDVVPEDQQASSYFQANLEAQHAFLFSYPPLTLDVIRIANNLGFHVAFDGYDFDENTEYSLELKFEPEDIAIVRIEETEPLVTYDIRCDNHQYLSDCLLHHNSGKSFLVAFLSTYLVHRLLKLQKPYRVFKLNKQTVLHGTFTAINSGQAKDTLWDPFYGFVAESPWFKKYHKLLDEYQRKTGRVLYKFMDTYLMYRHRNLMFNFVGPDKRALRGRTRVYACIEGNQLVSTNKGLVRMDQIENNQSANVGNKSAGIRNHQQTGTKEVWELQLLTGQTLSATPEHKICVYRENKFVKVKLKNLKAIDKVVVGLGGEFPEKLCLRKHAIDVRKTQKQELLERIASLESFDYASLLSGTDINKGYATNVISSLVAENCVAKHYRKGSMIKGMSRCYYNITESFDLENQLRSISNDKDLLTYPSEMTEDLASILGYLVADGAVIDNNLRGYKFDTQSLEKHIDYCDKFERCFGIKCNSAQYGNVYRAVFSHRELITFFDNLGLDRDYSADKKIPWSILQAPRKCVEEYLRSAFDCDGRVTNRSTVQYSTISPVLAQQFQLLLQRLGFHVSIAKSSTAWGSGSRKIPEKYGDRVLHLYVLSFSRSYSRKFIAEIGFRFKNVIDVWRTDGRSMYDTCELTKRDNLVTVGIKSITNTGRVVPTYDMTVDMAEHAYTASGILVSNSVDEIGWFDNDASSSKVKINASEIYIALERSLRTVRNSEKWQLRNGFDRALTGFMYCVSSPSNIRDKICELVRLSNGSMKSLGLHKPTWEMNPEITREDLAEEFRKDPVNSERDYGANPPLSSSTFIAAKAAAFDCFRKKGRNLVQITYKTKVHRDETRTRWAEITRIKIDSFPSVMTIDAGETNNSFSVSVGHIDRETNKPTIDILLEIQPLPGVSLDYNRIYTNLLVPICEKRNVKVVMSDRWNSTKILQDLEADVESVEYTKKYSLKYTDMWNTKTAIEATEISFPRLSITSPDEILDFSVDDYPHCFAHKPADHLFLQLLTVTDTGKTVTKGSDLTDDSWRTVCLFDYACSLEEYADILTMSKEEARLRVGGKRIASVGSAHKKLTRVSGTRTSSIGSIGGRK